MVNVWYFATQVKIPSQTKVVQVYGDWVVQKQVIPFTMDYENALGRLRARHDGKHIYFDKMVNDLTNGKYQLAFYEDGNPPKYSSIELSGIIHLENKTSLSVNKKKLHSDKDKTSVIIRGADEHTKAFIIFEESDVAHLAIAAEYYQGALQSIIRQLTGLDIAQVPCFGSATFSTFSYTHSETSFEPTDPDIFTNTTLLRTLNGPLEDKLVMQAKLGLWMDVTFKIEKNGDGLTLTPNTAEFQLHRLYDCMTSLRQQRKTVVSFGRLSATEVNINLMSLSSLKKTLIIKVGGATRNLCFYYNLLCFSEFQAKVSVSSDQTYTVQITNGTIPVGNTVFTGNALTDTISGKDSTISRDQLERHFHAERGLLPAEFYSWISQDLHESRLYYRPSRWLDSVDFRAQTTILQNQQVNIQAIVHRQDEHFYVIYGFHLDSTNLITYFNALSSYRFDTIAILQQSAEIHVSLSAIAVEDTPLYAQVRRGLHISTNIIASHCGGDRFCGLLGNLYPNYRIGLTATIQDLRTYALRAQLGEVDLEEELKFTNVSLVIEASTPPVPQYFLTAKVKDIVFGITFQGQLLESGKLLLTDPNKDATIRPGLLAKNFRGSAVINPDGSIGRREYHVEIQIPNFKEACLKLCQATITTHGIVGVAPGSKDNTYWFTNLPDSIQIGCLLQSLDVTHETHWPIRTSKLLTGAFVSYTDRDEVDVDTTDRAKIPKGRHFSGKVYTLCINANITALSLPDKLDKVAININFPVINIHNDMFIMAKDSQYREGPSLRTVVGDTDSLKIQGHFKVLDMKIDNEILLNDEGFKMEISDGFLQSKNGTRYSAYLCIQAPQDCIDKVDYLVSGYFKNLTDIILGMIKPLTESFAKKGPLELPYLDFDPILQESLRITDENRNAEEAVRKAQSSYDTARTAGKFKV